MKQPGLPITAKFKSYMHIEPFSSGIQAPYIEQIGLHPK